MGKKLRSKYATSRIVVEYLSDPENSFCSRAELSTKVCGYANPNQLNSIFTGVELKEMEAEAAIARVHNSHRRVSNIFDVLYRKAKRGDIGAIRLYLDRILGKIPDKVNIDTGPQLHDLLSNINQAPALIDALKRRAQAIDIVQDMKQIEASTSG